VTVACGRGGIFAATCGGVGEVLGVGCGDAGVLRGAARFVFEAVSVGCGDGDARGGCLRFLDPGRRSLRRVLSVVGGRAATIGGSLSAGLLDEADCGDLVGGVGVGVARGAAGRGVGVAIAMLDGGVGLGRTEGALTGGVALALGGLAATLRRAS
jgi:hypothetical protein